MSEDKGSRPRKIERSQEGAFTDQLLEYYEDERAREVAAAAEAKYGELISATPGNYREWVKRIALALEETRRNPPARSLRSSRNSIIELFQPDFERRMWKRRQWQLENFLDSLPPRRRSRPDDSPKAIDVLQTVLTFLDAQDYEKRPWEDDSSCLVEAMEYCDEKLEDLIQAALAVGDEYTRRTAAKWLARYASDEIAAPVYTGLLHDSEPRVRWWAAVHLSRIAPETEGLIAVLVEAMKGKWMPSARVLWCFGLSGMGEAAEALGHLGNAAREAIPDLMEAIALSGRNGFAYNEQLAARAIWRIAGGEETVRLLAPRRNLDQRIGTLLDEIETVERGGEPPEGDWPQHACFIARFVWRQGEDDYWKHARPDARGAV
jgi:hypothetical protein